MMDDHDDKHNNHTVHGKWTRKTAVATNEDKNNYRHRGNMIGGRRRAGVCLVNQNGGKRDSNRMQNQPHK